MVNFNNSKVSEVKVYGDHGRGKVGLRKRQKDVMIEGVRAQKARVRETNMR